MSVTGILRTIDIDNLPDTKLTSMKRKQLYMRLNNVSVEIQQNTIIAIILVYASEHDGYNARVDQLPYDMVVDNTVIAFDVSNLPGRLQRILTRVSDLIATE